MQHECAILSVYRDAPVARDIARNGISRYRVAAFGDAGQQIVYATHRDVRFCCALGCGFEDIRFCCFDYLIRQLLLDGDGDAALGDLVATDCGEQIFQIIVVQSLRELFLVDGMSRPLMG